jgi:hypothetical protein
VPEADAEDRNVAGELANIFMGVRNRFGIAGTVREKDAVGLEVENVFGGSVRGNHGDVALMIDEQTQNVLLNSKIVSDDAKFASVGRGTGFAHLFGPRRGGEIDGVFLPVVGFITAHATGEFLASHERKLLGFEDQLIGGGAVGGNDAAKSAHFADVENERAGIDVPDDGDFMAIEIELGRFAGAPVRSDLRKFANDQ